MKSDAFDVWRLSTVSAVRTPRLCRGTFMVDIRSLFWFILGLWGSLFMRVAERACGTREGGGGVGWGDRETGLTEMLGTYPRSARCDAGVFKSTALWWGGENPHIENGILSICSVSTGFGNMLSSVRWYSHITCFFVRG